MTSKSKNSELTMILNSGIASLSTSVMKKGFLKTFPFPTHLNKMVLLKGKNRTLIEAARTMLSGSVFSKQYWTEAVATACYTQNRSTIVKRHLKTPYEIFLSFDQNGQIDQNDQSAQTDEILNDDQFEHPNHTNDKQIIENLPNTKDIQISEHSSSPNIEDTSVQNTIPILNPFLSIPSMVTPAPQTHGSRIQEEVFGVNNRLSKRRQSRGEKVKNCRGQQGFLVANHLEFYYFWFVMDVLISAANVPCCSQFNQ
ncbi:retrovirus-related pol polyprotein from transposon TNT 1-94 [Tanacetum coccineum]